MLDAVTADRDRWADLMLQLEHGVAPARPRPLRSGLATFAAFVVVGLPITAAVLVAFGVHLAAE